MTVRGLSFACLLSTPTSLLTHKQPTQLLSYTYIYSPTPPTPTPTHTLTYTHLHSPASTQPIAARSISLKLDVQKRRQLWRQGSLCPLASLPARSPARLHAHALAPTYLPSTTPTYFPTATLTRLLADPLAHGTLRQ